MPFNHFNRLFLLSTVLTFSLAASNVWAQGLTKVTLTEEKTAKAAPVAVVRTDAGIAPVDGIETNPLRKALVEAYLHNPELEAQRKGQNVVDERVPQALSGALPTAAISYEDGRRRTRFGSGAKWSFGQATTENLSVTQPLFRGGTTWANVKSARHDVRAGQARLTQVEQEVLLNTVRAYMEVVQTQAVVDLSKKNFDVLGKQFEAANQRFEVGEDTRTDVAQSESRLALAKSQLVESEGRFASAKASFRRFVGYDPDDALMPEKMPELPKSLKAAIELAKANNPRLREVNHRKESADYQINADVGRLLPSVNLRGTVNRQQGAGVFGNSDFDQDELMLNMSVPLFQGGAEYSRVREAREQYQQQRFLELDMSQQVHQQVVSAWENLQATEASMVSNQAAIDAAKIALDGVKQEQQYGARTTLDVLDAERELFDTEVRYITSRQNHVVAVYTLLSSVGNLTAESLDLEAPVYDPNKHFEDVEYQFIGF
jgi:outer membrane protein